MLVGLRARFEGPYCEKSIGHWPATGMTGESLLRSGSGSPMLRMGPVQDETTRYGETSMREGESRIDGVTMSDGHLAPILLWHLLGKSLVRGRKSGCLASRLSFYMLRLLLTTANGWHDRSLTSRRCDRTWWLKPDDAVANEWPGSWV